MQGMKGLIKLSKIQTLDWKRRVTIAVTREFSSSCKNGVIQPNIPNRCDSVDRGRVVAIVLRKN
jgi:hypothetical protein